DRAWKMMAHTALAQAALKQAAGIKATGRKLTSPVMAYSLSWHPDERPDRDEQMKAARDTLKAMGLEPLGMDTLEPWQKVEPEQMAEGEGNVALPMAVDVGLLHVHLGAVPQYALDHGCDFGGGWGLEL